LFVVGRLARDRVQGQSELPRRVPRHSGHGPSRTDHPVRQSWRDQ